jgi:hypothetical protein
MKASEVLRRYAAGERNFRRADLRGRSLNVPSYSSARAGLQFWVS